MIHDMSNEKHLKRESYRRFVYIETCLYWGEGVSAGALGKTFGIARQNAQNSIMQYRQRHPDNMLYNTSTKRHEISSTFQPFYINQEPLRYLDYLRGNSLANHYWEDEDWNHLPVVDVDSLFKPQIDGDIARLVVSAIRDQKTLQLYYHAKFAGFENLAISPNHLVYASGRYHVRAYCFERNRFIDLVLSRMLSADLADKDWVSSDEDELWNSYDDLCFMPNPELTDATRETLLLDYRIKNGIYKIPRVRLALKPYVLRAMERHDWRQQIPLWQFVE